MATAHLLLMATLLPLPALTAHLDSGIVNGREAKPHSRPYMVSVQQNSMHTCGGFLVSQSFVMTAAHCFKWGQKLTVLIGAHDINEKQNVDRAQVKLYYIHPRFEPGTLENDIMLLQLKNKVKKSKEVQWIPLPKKANNVKPKSICSVAGWGANVTNGHAMPRLMEANVTVVDRMVCRKMWGKKPITPRMMCAGGSAGKGAFCQGDSGGPLVCLNTAEGIVSFNEKENCNAPNRPNVYTQISKYLPWVNSIMTSMN